MVGFYFVPLDWFVKEIDEIVWFFFSFRDLNHNHV